MVNARKLFLILTNLSLEFGLLQPVRHQPFGGFGSLSGLAGRPMVGLRAGKVDSSPVMHFGRHGR
jgi:hypothetical protein